jgi:hypothetical protein
MTRWSTYWANRLPSPTPSAFKAVDGTVEVVSDGHWKLFDR